ncbi:MAG: lipopolysaccharide biosynthesis protein [Clostridiales bacterium]|nr:lipopolysaccharide biosynthesis protein [Clostridiales bacterium]
MDILRTLLINDDKATLERRNMTWNMLGSFLYAFASMVLTMIVVQLVGDEQGGIFTFAFTTFGQQMFMVAYFGIRPYQITDVENRYSFGEYLHLRILTSAAAILIGISFILVQGYSRQKSLVVFLMVCYKVIDGFADAYEAEFQRGGRLYLTGKSNAFRTILSVGSFFISLYLTRNLVLAAGVAVMAQLAGLILFDISVIRALPNVDWSWKLSGCRSLVKSCVLLFLSVFLDFYIFSAAKYAIDRHMSATSMAVYGAIFMPTSVINLVAGFVIRPFLTKLSLAWETQDHRTFSSVIRMIFLVILGLTVLAVAGAALLGIPVISLLYPNLREPLAACRLPLVMIILGGGFNAWMNLFYYSLVIMKRQSTIFAGYILVCIVAATISGPAVIRAGLWGGAASYLILMILLAFCFGIMTLAGLLRGKTEKRNGKLPQGQG